MTTPTGPTTGRAPSSGAYCSGCGRARGEGPFCAGCGRQHETDQVIDVRDTIELPRSAPPAAVPTVPRQSSPLLPPRPTAPVATPAPEPEPSVEVRRSRWHSLTGRTRAAVAAAVVVAASETGDPAAEPRATTTSACVELPYRPCGEAVAPGTDGRRCLPGRDDYDDDPANGCEAAADDLPDGAELVDALEATIVPRADVDTFTLDVGDGAQLLCDGRLTVALTAPEGVTLRLEVLDDGDVLGQATSADGVPAEVVLREPQCLADDSTTLTARVSPIGTDRSAQPYRIERRGSF